MRFLLIVALGCLPLYAQVSGTVRNGITQDPIEGAMVRFQNRPQFAITDDLGQFILEDEGPGNLMVAAYGYFNQPFEVVSAGPQSGLAVFMEGINQASQPDHVFNPPGMCASCHTQQVNQYENSPMGNTSLNIWVFDLLDGSATPGTGSNGFVYERDSIHAGHSPHSECAACHSPTHFLNNPHEGLGDFHNATTEMLLGIQCEICHRAFHIEESRKNWPGVIPPEDGGAVTLIRNNDPLEFGLLGDVDNMAGMRGSYNPQMSSLLCAACHEDNVDSDEDGDFEDLDGTVPAETTYSEWLIYEAQHGEEALSCVDCHMPVLDVDSFCHLSPLDRSGKVRSHDIRGTSPEFLENALDFQVDTEVGLNQVNVTVTLTNSETGHSVPTGVPIRNLILLVLARDSELDLVDQVTGGTIDEVGGIHPGTHSFDLSQGYFAGLPGKAFYFNHTDGVHQRVFFTEASSIFEDSRIKPGETYSDTFGFQLPHQEPNLDLEVKLIYRRAFRDLLDTKGWTTTGLGQQLADLQPDDFGHRMAYFSHSQDVCADRDLDGTGSVDSGDLHAAASLWTHHPPPFGTEPKTDIRHLLAIVRCIQGG